MLQPPILQTGDKAVILSPAGKIDAGLVAKAADLLCDWGLGVEISENALCRTGRFSGFVEQRLADLQRAMDDPEVKLIFCSRGGYGTVHLLDKLDFTGIRQYPKWVVGYSDITVLHATLQQHGIMSVHGPMAKHFAEEGPGDISVRFTKAILAGEPVFYDIPVAKYAYLNRKGKASGRLFGGNLSVFCGILGTRFAYLPKNGILFIEDIGEEPYKIDRYINQLKLAGIFDRISGLIVGQFSDYTEDNDMYSALYESMASVVAGYDFPVCFDFPAGHVKHNFPLVMGKTARFVVKEDQLIFKQS
ncbi:S66 peptidase family protein [Petrimonas sulfuriphila]|jgi:muramoyltetrapeptide carboxypeptidase|uniref:S66 peptidase family protein n=1 Tax=Petrimonas sulfuriphila TaxID=285070 RepID=UPI003EB792E6